MTPLHQSRDMAGLVAERVRLYAQPQRLMILSFLLGGEQSVGAIDAATRQWMGWTIDRRTSKDYGIPRGMPYLIGFVIHCEIGEEATAG